MATEAPNLGRSKSVPGGVFDAARHGIAKKDGLRGNAALKRHKKPIQILAQKAEATEISPERKEKPTPPPRVGTPTAAVKERELSPKSDTQAKPKPKGVLKESRISERRTGAAAKRAAAKAKRAKAAEQQKTEAAPSVAQGAGPVAKKAPAAEPKKAKYGPAPGAGETGKAMGTKKTTGNANSDQAKGAACSRVVIMLAILALLIPAAFGWALYLGHWRNVRWARKGAGSSGPVCVRGEMCPRADVAWENATYNGGSWRLLDGVDLAAGWDKMKKDLAEGWGKISFGRGPGEDTMEVHMAELVPAVELEMEEKYAGASAEELGELAGGAGLEGKAMKKPVWDIARGAAAAMMAKVFAGKGKDARNADAELLVELEKHSRDTAVDVEIIEPAAASFDSLSSDASQSWQSEPVEHVEDEEVEVVDDVEVLEAAVEDNVDAVVADAEPVLGEAYLDVTEVAAAESIDDLEPEVEVAEEVEDYEGFRDDAFDEDDVRELMEDFWAQGEELDETVDEELDAAADGSEAAKARAARSRRQADRLGNLRGTFRGQPRPGVDLRGYAPGSDVKRTVNRTEGDGEFGDSFGDGYEQHDDAETEETMTSASDDLSSAKTSIGERGGRQDLEDLVAAEQRRVEAERRAEAEAAAAARATVEDELLMAAMDDGEDVPVKPVPATLSPIGAIFWRGASSVSRSASRTRRAMLRPFQPNVRRVVHTLRCGRQEDHYCVLGLQPNALQKAIGWHPRPSPKAIKAAHRRMALRLHPDKNRHPKAQVAFDLAQRAYETLKDPESHAAWRLQCEAKRERRRHNRNAAATATSKGAWNAFESLARGDFTLLIVFFVLLA